MVAFVGSPWSENPEKNIEAGQREAGVLKCSALPKPTDSSDRNNKQEYLTGSVAPIFPFKEVQMIKGRIELFSNDSNKLSCFSAFFGITALY